MRFSTITGAALAGSVTLARELPKDELRAAQYYDNRLKHTQNMERKKAKWEAEYESGELNSAQWPRLNYTECIDGKARAVEGDPRQTFRCRNFDLYDFLNHATLGSPNGWPDDGGDYPFLTASGSWGWVEPDSGREFIASGLYDGVAFLEILPEGRFAQLAFLPCPVPAVGRQAVWKEIRGYKHYMLIGSELTGHGVLFFDMTKLLTIPRNGTVVQYDPIDDLHGRFLDLPEGASHNVVVAEESEFGVAVGSRPLLPGCAGGLIMFDLQDPANPVKLGCNSDDGYVHDAQCLVYRGPHTKYVGHDICYGYNEDTLTIYDVTDKANSSVISVTSYEGATYTHQGWVLDPMNQEYLVMDDEVDELEMAGPAIDQFAVTYIWDIRDLENPKQSGLYKSTTRTIDHNQYIIDGLNFQSNYMSGLRVYDVSSIPSDPSGGSVCEIAYFDIYPEDDDEPGGGIADMYGTWSSFAFPSGFVFINTIERGGYLVKMTRREACEVEECKADTCLRVMRGSFTPGRLQESQEFCADFTDGVKDDPDLIPDYATNACGSQSVIVHRVSSACDCLPAATPIA